MALTQDKEKSYEVSAKQIRNNDFSRSVKYLRNINSIHIKGTVPVIFEIYRGGALIL